MNLDKLNEEILKLERLTASGNNEDLDRLMYRKAALQGQFNDEIKRQKKLRRKEILAAILKGQDYGMATHRQGIR